MPFAGPSIMGIDANPDSSTSTAPTSSLLSAAWKFVKRFVAIVVLVCGTRLTKETHQTCVSQSGFLAMITRWSFVSELIFCGKLTIRLMRSGCLLFLLNMLTGSCKSSRNPSLCCTQEPVVSEDGIGTTWEESNAFTQAEGTSKECSTQRSQNGWYKAARTVIKVRLTGRKVPSSAHCGQFLFYSDAGCSSTTRRSRRLTMDSTCYIVSSPSFALSSSSYRAAVGVFLVGMRVSDHSLSHSLASV